VGEPEPGLPICPNCKQEMGGIRMDKTPAGIAVFTCPMCNVCLGAQLLPFPNDFPTGERQ
jgi:hypothetical protein